MVWVEDYKKRGDCYHTILTFNRQFNLTSLIGAMAIAPYGVFVC